MPSPRRHVQIYHGTQTKGGLRSFPPPTDNRPLGSCLVCGLTVNLRKGGEVGSHRVGYRYKESWPCPGSAGIPKE